MLVPRWFGLRQYNCNAEGYAKTLRPVNEHDGRGPFGTTLSLARISHERFCYKRGYAAATGSLAAHPFDILHEYASGFHGSECPPRFAAAHFRDEPS